MLRSSRQRPTASSQRKGMVQLQRPWALAYPLPVKQLRCMWMLTTLSGLISCRAHSVVGSATSVEAQGESAKYRILAFGDSLTEGFYDYGTRFHPYSRKLEELLKENGYSAKVYERGESGERVVGGMVSRLPALLKLSEEQGIRFNWVVILGGINDIGWGGNPKDIFRGLQSMYEHCHQHGARVLALTCLENVGSNAANPDARSQLNDLIRGAATGSDYIALLDIEKKLPFPHADAYLTALWSDGLHLSPEGYDTMGRIVYEALQVKLEK